MVLHIAKIANTLNQTNITFSLDHLPGNAKTTMKFMKILGQYPVTLNYLKKIEEKFKVGIEIANMVSYTNQEGIKKHAKSNPGMVLIDWIVHSTYCAKNELTNIDNGTRDESFRISMSKPYEALKETNKIQLLPFGGIVFESDDDFTDELKEQISKANFVNVFEDS